MISINLAAQEATFETRQSMPIYAGPGMTFEIVGRLAWQDDAIITERNRAGTWVRVEIVRSGGTEIDGWVLTGNVIFPSGTALGDIPVNATIADANPDNIDSATLSDLYAVPILSPLPEAMLDVYTRGQESGNQPDVVTKVGDSLMASHIYLNPINLDDHHLHPYDYLTDVVDYYRAPEESVAAQIGLSSFAVFDSMWADQERCESGETPLACELRLTRPVTAMIMFGPNDVRAMNNDTYEAEMRRIVETVLDHDVIPVLFTFSVHPDDEFWWQSLNFNLILSELAAEYNVPVVNLWAAARILPVYGLDEDNIHLAHSGYDHFIFDTGHEIYYGVSLQNLLTLGMLHEIYTATQGS